MKKWCVDKLNNEEMRYNYSKEVNDKLREIHIQKQKEKEIFEINDEWKSLKKAVINAAENQIGSERNVPIKP